MNSSKLRACTAHRLELWVKYNFFSLLSFYFQQQFSMGWWVSGKSVFQFKLCLIWTLQPPFSVLNKEETASGPGRSWAGPATNPVVCCCLHTSKFMNSPKLILYQENLLSIHPVFCCFAHCFFDLHHEKHLLWPPLNCSLSCSHRFPFSLYLRENCRGVQQLLWISLWLYKFIFI